MANQNAKVDDNRVKTLLAITDEVTPEVRRLLVDSTTGRLKVSATITGYGSSASGTVDTTDATPTTIASIDITEDEVIYVDAKVIGRKSDGSAIGIFHITGFFYRNTGGNVTKQGDTIALNITKTDVSWDCDFALDTVNQEIEIQVTGVAGTNISWEAWASYYSLT